MTNGELRELGIEDDSELEVLRCGRYKLIARGGHINGESVQPTEVIFDSHPIRLYDWFEEVLADADSPHCNKGFFDVYRVLWVGNKGSKKQYAVRTHRRWHPEVTSSWSEDWDEVKLIEL